MQLQGRTSSDSNKLMSNGNNDNKKITGNDKDKKVISKKPVLPMIKGVGGGRARATQLYGDLVSLPPPRGIETPNQQQPPPPSPSSSSTTSSALGLLASDTVFLVSTYHLSLSLSLSLSLKLYFCFLFFCMELFY